MLTYVAGRTLLMRLRPTTPYFVLVLLTNNELKVIPLAFVVSIKGPGGVPQINFSNQGDPCKPFPGTDLLHCPQIGYSTTSIHLTNIIKG